jgi:hypothetical protein
MAGKMSSILRELEQVQDRLSALCGDDGADKLDLMTRQEELRTRAARLAEDVDAGCSTQQLLTDLAKLRRRRDVLDRQRVRGGSGPAPQPSGPGYEGVSQVEQRVKRIRSLLADRGIRVQ